MNVKAGILRSLIIGVFMEEKEISVFRKMQQGDSSALEYFFQEYTDLLYYRALGYVKEPLVAEDMVQEVFIRFWEQRKKLDISVSVAGYLTRSVVNRAKNYLEHISVRQRYEKEFLNENPEKAEESLEEAEDWEQLRERLKIFIDSLPEKCREIFLLACIEGLKYREVAERLGLSVNTVKTQVKSAYAKLRSDFEVKDRQFLIVMLFFRSFI